MKWYILQVLGVIPACILILLTKDIPFWSGIAIGVALTVYANYYLWLAKKESLAKEEKEYELFKAEMDVRSQALNSKWDANGIWIGDELEF